MPGAAKRPSMLAMDQTARAILPVITMREHAVASEPTGAYLPDLQPVDSSVLLVDPRTRRVGRLDATRRRKVVECSRRTAGAVLAGGVPIYLAFFRQCSQATGVASARNPGSHATLALTAPARLCSADRHT
jgi:hypothetical protein